jgi:serine/threonine-protein kinase
MPLSLPLRGLSSKIFLATALVIVVVLGGALLLTKYRADQAADESIAKALDATQGSIHDALARRSHTLQRVAASLAQVTSYVARVGQGIRQEKTSDLLDQADEFRNQTGAAWTLITDNSGILKAWTLHRDLAGVDMAEGALVGFALEGRPTEGLWVEPDENGYEHLFQAVGVPIVDPVSKTSLGVLVAALPLDSAFASELKRQTSSDIAFFSSDSTGKPHIVLSTLPPDEITGALVDLQLDSSFAAASAPGRVRARAEGETWLGVAGPLLSADGRHALGGYAGFRPRSVELAAYTALQRTVILAFGAGLVLALLSSLLVARQITAPVKRLVEASRQISEGQYTGSVGISSRDEIGELAAAFDRMRQDLKDKQELVEYLSAASGGTIAATTGSNDATRMISTAPPPTGALGPGALFSGRYEIKDVLGSGGMGVVYRALDRQLGEMVAIKTLKPELVQKDASSLERFKQEIRLARRITHRNVLRTHDLGEVDGIYYITMELAEGKSLSDLIQKRGRLPVGVTLTIGKQLCRALEVAHEEGVIHRDIKPQNMVVDPSGFLKVMDFGIARLVEGKRPNERGLTAQGAVIGTPDYMAPEQLTGDELDGRADLYAAGAVLFECLTGRPVFVASTITALIAAQLTDPAPDPRTINRDVPESLARVILKALEKDRNARWASAVEMGQALERVA